MPHNADRLAPLPPEWASAAESAARRFGLDAGAWGELKGRLFWVTGAGSGIGRALCLALAAAGAGLVLTGRRPDKLAETEHLIRVLGFAPALCLRVPADLTESADIARASARVLAEGGPIHGLISNAAIASLHGPHPLLDAPVEAWHRMMATNVTASFLLARAVLPAMLAAGSGRILMIGSEAGWAARFPLGDYNVSKAALNSLTANLASEVADAHPGADVQINLLVPGEVRSEMNTGSTTSPLAVCPMALALLAQPHGGPSGRLFHRDGRSLGFGYIEPYSSSAVLLPQETVMTIPAKLAEIRPSLFELLNYTAVVPILRHPSIWRALLFERIESMFTVDPTVYSWGMRLIPETGASIGELDRKAATGDERAAVTLSVALIQRRSYDIAADLLRALMERNPSLTGEERFLQAYACLMAGKTGEAMESFSLVDRQATHLTGYSLFGMGMAHHMQKNWNSAIQFYQAAMRTTPWLAPLAELNIGNANQRYRHADWQVILPRTFDPSEPAQERQLLDALVSGLSPYSPRLALLGSPQACRHLLAASPALREKTEVLVRLNGHDTGADDAGLPVVSPGNLPSDVQVVLVADTEILAIDGLTRAFQAERQGVACINLRTIVDLAPHLLPPQSWRLLTTIYPMPVPEPRVSPGLDLLLLDLPARMLAQLPNGLGYLEQILKPVNAKTQIVDADVWFYHRYHQRRLLDGLDRILTANGEPMAVDPWDTGCFTNEWVRPEVLDYFSWEIRTLTDAIVAAKPRVLGISLHQTNIPMAKAMVAEIRERLPETVILVGGYSCTYARTARKVFPDFDYMCIYEADLTLVPLLQAILAGEQPRDLPGVLSRYDSPDRQWQAAPLLPDADAIPWPRYEYTDVRTYTNFQGYQLVPVLSSRGCVWARCTFCAERFKWRNRKAESVVDEIAWHMDRGATLFHFNDSDLNGDPQSVTNICENIIARDIKPQLIGQLRITGRGTDPDYFPTLKRGGFSNLRFGVDAVSPHTLKLQRKGYTVKMIEQNLRNAAEAGIVVTVNLVICLPGETDADIDETIANIIRFKPYIHCIENINPLMIAAGSPYYETPEEFGIRFFGDKEDIYRRFPGQIPDEFWYSTDPQLGSEERLHRLQRVCAALHDAGFGLGPYAHAMIKRHNERLALAAQAHH